MFARRMNSTTCRKPFWQVKPCRLCVPLGMDDDIGNPLSEAEFEIRGEDEVEIHPVHVGAIVPLEGPIPQAPNLDAPPDDRKRKLSRAECIGRAQRARMKIAAERREERYRLELENKENQLVLVKATCSDAGALYSSSSCSVGKKNRRRRLRIFFHWCTRVIFQFVGSHT